MSGEQSALVEYVWAEAEHITGIPAATLAGLRAGSLVAVPVEPTRGLLTQMDTAFNAETFRVGCGADPMRRAYEAMLAAAQEAARDE